jgi:hypothetical protein
MGARMMLNIKTIVRCVLFMVPPYAALMYSTAITVAVS